MPDVPKLPSVPAPPAEAPKTPNVLPSGREILARLQADGTDLPEEDQKKLMEISDDEAMSKFLAANLGDTINPDEMEANSVFSSWMMDKLNIPPMLLTLQFDNVGQCGRAIEFCYKELAKTGAEGLTPEQRNNVLKTMVEAIKLRGYMVKAALQMAQLTKPTKPAKRGKNLPPDTLTKPASVVVQVNNVVQGAGSNEPKTLNPR